MGGGIEALQMYARGVVKRRSSSGRDKPRPPRDFEGAPSPHKSKGSYSFPTPPPHYRPVTPAPLYEVDAMEWWPNTSDAPLSHTMEGIPDPQASVGLEFNTGEHVLEPQMAGQTLTENDIFFQGDRLATPIRRNAVSPPPKERPPPTAQ